MCNRAVRVRTNCIVTFAALYCRADLEGYTGNISSKETQKNHLTKSKKDILILTLRHRLDLGRS